ncbi:hypothetical protein [Mesorhizobium sp. M0571]|uniref:hypothetical protein n=1 Tax=Mesorhizobium sp. M0571 TaxID=2956960 RepID=UPI003337A300
MDTRIANDGLDALRAEMSLAEIMRLIERTARWVDPETFGLLPTWYPEHRRRGLFYKANWSEPQLNRNRETGVVVHKHEGNLYANKTLTHALGLRSDDRPNWSCCHIWGIDDAKYASTNVIVQDARYYSCVANMVLLPTPLKAFTDVMPTVKAMLRTCAFYTYGWRCGHDAVPMVDLKAPGYNDAYPASWPNDYRRDLPPGIVPLNSAISCDAARRLNRIRHDLENAGPFYPRDQVRTVAEYWKINL